MENEGRECHSISQRLFESGPPELAGGMTRNEARQYRDIWEAVTDCLQHPLALTRSKDDRTRAIAFSLNPLKYDKVIDMCAKILARNQRSLLKWDYTTPVLPMFGRTGASDEEIEIYKFYDFEVLETCFRRDVELFVLYLTRFEKLCKDAEVEVAVVRDSPPHLNSPRGGPRTSTPRGLANKSGPPPPVDSDDSDVKVDERTVRSPRPPPHRSYPHKKRHHSSNRYELPRRGRRFTEIFGVGGTAPMPDLSRRPAGGDPSDDSSSDSDSSNGGNGGRGRQLLPPPGNPPRQPNRNTQPNAGQEAEHREVT